MSNNFQLTKAQWQAFQEIQKGGYKYIALYGGGRSGKTMLILYMILLRAIQYPNSTHLIVRSTHSAMKSSVYFQSFGKLLNFANVKGACSYKRNEVDLTIKLENGSVIQMRGLDHERRQESLLGNEYSTIYFNECSNLNYALMASLPSRLAENICAINQIYYDFNPPTKAHWSYKFFVQKIDPITRISLPYKEQFYIKKINPTENPHVAKDYIQTQKDQGSAIYKRFVEGDFQDVGGVLISRDMFSTYYEADLDQYWVDIFIVVDVAYMDKEKSDYSVITVWGINQQGFLYLFDLDRFKKRGTMFDRRLRAFYDLWKDGFKNGSSGLTNIYIEKSGNTRLIDALETEYGSYIVNTDLPRTTNKFSRFLNAQGFIENGKVYVPDAEIEIRGRGKARAFLETFFDECEAFTDNPKDYENDDIVDCLSDACYLAINKAKMNFDFSGIFG